MKLKKLYLQIVSKLTAHWFVYLDKQELCRIPFYWVHRCITSTFIKSIQLEIELKSKMDKLRPQ